MKIVQTAPPFCNVMWTRREILSTNSCVVLSAHQVGCRRMKKRISNENRKTINMNYNQLFPSVSYSTHVTTTTTVDAATAQHMCTENEGIPYATSYAILYAHVSIYLQTNTIRRTPGQKVLTRPKASIISVTWLPQVECVCVWVASQVGVCVTMTIRVCREKSRKNEKMFR